MHTFTSNNDKKSVQGTFSRAPPKMLLPDKTPCR